MDRSVLAPLTRPRHLLTTLVVAFITGALGVTAASISADVPASTASPWDLPFAVPQPHVGDHGRYVHAGGNDGRTDGYWPTFVDFAWMGTGSAYNGTGTKVLVNHLAYYEDRPGAEAQVVSVVPGSTQRVIGGYDSNQTYVNSREGLWPGGNESSVDQIHHVSFVGYERPLSIWCGIINPLQGHAVRLADVIPDSTECWGGPGSWNVDGFAVVVTQVGGADGNRVALFEGRMQNRGKMDSDAFLRSYYREGVAYPVRLEYVSGAVGGECSCSAIYTLEGLTVGTIAVATEPLVLAPPPQAAILGPRTETGPDATAVDHPFPLAEAWAHARDDATYTALADYRVAHPDNYIGHAMYGINTQDARAIHRWYIVLTDGAEQFAFLVERTDTAAPRLPPPLAPPTVAPIATPNYRYDSLNEAWHEGPYLPADSLPALMPTVASMMEAWTAFSDRSDFANSWYFDLRPSCRDGSCEPLARYTAGVLHDDFAGVSTVASHRTIARDELEFDAAGRPIGALMQASTMTTTFDALSDPEPTAGGPDQDAALSALSTVPSGGDWSISPREAVAAGGLAALTAVAYFLWPLAKGGAIGLFSRVQKDRLLDSPVRQQLVQRIEAEPGIHHSALVRELGRGNGATEHHLDKLVEGRLILRHRGTGFTCYFPLGTDRRAMAAAPATKADGARRILQALQSGQSGVRQIAHSTGLSPSTVSHHLERLRQVGLVTGDGRSGYSATSPTGAGAAA